METRHTKRGRPSKGEDRRKAQYLDIRLEATEKKAFKDAADLAGLDLSAWVRERLRAIARTELGIAGIAVAFLKARPVNTIAKRKAHLVNANFVRPSSVELSFSDGLSGRWSFRQLELDMTKMKLTTIRASSIGNAVEVKSKLGEVVQLDSSWLRALIDPEYAAEIEQTLDALTGL